MGYREIQRERRKILLILEYVDFYDRVQLRIVNTGHRPITITKVGISILQTQDDHTFWDDVPANAVIGYPFFPPVEDIEYKEPLPAVVQDGEQITFPLSEVVSSMLSENGMQAKIFVYDGEGKVFTKYKKMLFNAKWGRYEPLPPSWK